jgi:hypothetical protein
MPLLVGQKVVYRGTITGLRISAVDGTAFIDNLPLTYSSDFSAGVDGWSATQGTAEGNIDSIGGVDNWLRLTVNNVSFIHGLSKSSVFTAGKKYTLTFKYYVPSGQTAVLGIVPMEQSGSSKLPGATYASGNTTDSVTTYSLTFTAPTGTTGLFVAATTGSGVILQDAGGDDVFYIKDIKISEIQPYADGNHQIEIYDSSNRMLKGVLKAAGTSETLGDETVSGFTNISYDVFTTSGADITNAEKTTLEIKSCYQNYSYLLTALYKSVISLSLVSGSAPLFGIGNAYTLGKASNNAKSLSDGVNTNYHTPLTGFGACGFYNIANGQWNTSGISLKQVLAPSSSGATIVSAKGGTTYNFSYKNASFKYNEASYYVIIRAIR